MVEQYIDSLHMESCGHARETEDEGEHTGVSEVQQHIFLPFHNVMTAYHGGLQINKTLLTLLDINSQTQ